MTGSRTFLSALVVAGALLAAPAMASADTYCINAGADCPAGGVPIGDLQTAMNTAATTDLADTILLGDKGTPYVGPFVYRPQTREPNLLTLKGVGGRPALTGPVGDTAVALANTTLEGVDVVTEFGEGQALDVQSSQLSHVNVVGPSFDAPDMRGIRASGTTIEDTQVTGGFESALAAVGRVGGDEVTARRLRIDSTGIAGVFVGDQAGLILVDSRVKAASLAVTSQGTVSIAHSALATTGPSSVGVLQDGASGMVLLDHVTVAHRGTPSGSDAAIRLNADVAGINNLLFAVALDGYTRGFRRVSTNGFANPVKVENSVWDPAHDELGGAGEFVESGNAHTDPALADDLRPNAGSAVIDRDAFVDPSLYFDLDGSPALDGDGDGIVRADAGAFEFRPTAQPAPSAPAGATGGAEGTSGGAEDTSGGSAAADTTAPALRTVALRSGGLRVAGSARLPLSRARRLRLVFDVSEAARIRIVPRRVVAGRLLRARGAISRDAAAGRGSIGLAQGLRRLRALRAGELRLIVTAKDAAGNRSPKRVLKLRLRR